MRNEFSIVISLRNDMFELAHRLVGIYKTSNVSLSSLFFSTSLKTKKLTRYAQCTKSIAIDNKDLRLQARPKRPPGVPPPTPGTLTTRVVPLTPTARRRGEAKVEADTVDTPGTVIA